MPIQKQAFDFFKHRGMDAENSDATLEDGFYKLLQNVEISSDSTLKKRPGYQGFGGVLSTTAVKQFDKYVTEDSEKLIASVDSKIYYSDTDSMPSTTISLRATLDTASDYNSTARTIKLNFTGTHPFEVDDDIAVTVDGTAYNFTVITDDDSDTVTVAGAYEDFTASVVGTEVCYGGRISEELTVADATNFTVNDMITIGDFVRHFKVSAIDTVATPNTLTLDESLSYQDNVSPDAVAVSERWTQFTKASGTIQDDTPLDSSVTQPYMSSNMLRKSLLMTDGENEPLKYDGTEIHRLGFHELPDVIDSLAIEAGVVGNVSEGTHKYKITYSVYDNNGELVESGTTYERTILTALFSGDDRNILIPVVVIPYGVQNNLLYNVDRSVVTVYRTVKDGTDYYRAVEIPMNTLGSFHIEAITNPSGTDMQIEVAGTPDISNLVVGDFLTVKGCKDAANDGVWPITAIDNTNKYITVTNAAVVADSTGTPASRGNCSVCIRDNVSDETLIVNDILYNNKGVEDDNDSPPVGKYITTWDNRAWLANGKTYQELFVNMDFATASTLEDEDEFYITDGVVTEQYVFQDTGDAAANDFIRIERPSAGFTSHYDMIQAVCEAINSKADGLVWAYYERVAGAATFILRERERNTTTLQFKFNLTTAANMAKIKIGDLYLTAADNDVYKDFTQTNFSSRVWFSKEDQPASFVGTYGNFSTDSVFYEDVQPENGQSVTGMMPMSNFMLIFKEDSLFRVTKSGTDSYSWEVIDSEVGCIAPKSIISIGNRVLFLSRYGVYETDGFFTRFIGKRVRREWENMNETYQHLSCASHNVERNQYWICIPYDEEDEDATGNNNVMVYDYINDSWSRYTNYCATTFTKINNVIYFATDVGTVYTIRREEEASDYRDDATAINATVITKWFNLGDNSARKMFQYLITHLYQTGVDSSLKVYYAYDFNESFTQLENISSNVSPWGYFAWGEDPWGFLALELKKQPLRPQKTLYARFKFVNDVKDEVLEIQGITLEAKVLNSQVISQVDSRSTG